MSNELAVIAAIAALGIGMAIGVFAAVSTDYDKCSEHYGKTMLIADARAMCKEILK